jgi:hypothetical protein
MAHHRTKDRGSKSNMETLRTQVNSPMVEDMFVVDSACSNSWR